MAATGARYARNRPFGKPTTLARLEALGEQLDGGNPVLRRIRVDDKPVTGTRLMRNHQGVAVADRQDFIVKIDRWITVPEDDPHPVARSKALVSVRPRDNAAFVSGLLDRPIQVIRQRGHAGVDAD